MCRIIAGPTVTRILAEYGADVLKITSPSLSDVPFFQVDGNMGKHAADLDLKTEAGRQEFEKLLDDVDVIVDGYRPGALDKLGYGAEAMAALAEKRGKGIVYVNENCFGYEGEWAGRAGWQQIADCVSYHWHLPQKPKVNQSNSKNRSLVSPGPKANSWASPPPSFLPSQSLTTGQAAWAPLPP
jgi:hypothetical protein